MNDEEMRSLCIYFQVIVIKLMFCFPTNQMDFSSFKKCFQLQPHYLFRNKWSTVATDLRSHEETKRKWCQETGSTSSHSWKVEGIGMNCSTPGLPVHHHRPEFTQTHVHRVGNAIQPSKQIQSRK